MRRLRIANRILGRLARHLQAAVPYETYVKDHPGSHLSKPEYERKYLGQPRPKKRFQYPPKGQKPQQQQPQAPHPQKTPQQAQPDQSEANKKRVQETDKNKTKHVNELKDPAYQKKGSEVSKQDVDKFVGEFHQAFQETESWHDDFLANGAKSFSGRLKDETSLFDKMQGRFKDRTLNSVGDVVGTRAICKNVQDQKRLVDYIYKNYEVLEHDNSVDDKVRPDGYRAHHFTLKSKDGRLIELQVKTENQQAYSGYTHDKIYKGSDEVKNHPDVKKYTKALSDYIYAKDTGQKVGAPPEPPQILKDKGILFNHREIK